MLDIRFGQHWHIAARELGNFANDAWEFPLKFDDLVTCLLTNKDIFRLARSLQ